MALSSTLITPALVGYMRKRHSRSILRSEEGGEQQDDELGGKVVRTVGLWGISLQFLCMASPS